jgi:RNA polymerase sigma-70 factor (ECF subfamily)
MQQGFTANTDEEQQILAARQNPAHFNVLYQKYYAPILKFVYQRVTSRADAADITQQVFLQAMLSLHKYEFRGLPFSSWLYRIAINEMNNIFRKNEKQRGINLNDSHLKDVAEEIGEMNIEVQEQVLLEALTTLDEDDYQLVEMRFFEKRPFKEIGEILNISEPNAKMRLYRILEKLKPLIEKQLRNK